MIIKASAKFVKGSPRKVRLIANYLVGLSPVQAIARLSLLTKKQTILMTKIIKQGVANAKNNFKIDPESLKIKSIIVGEGPRVKRMDKSHAARFDDGIIKKRSFHIWVILESEETPLRPAESAGLRRGKENGQ